jgi:hypothetical protein
VLWWADHTNGVGWTVNTAANGLIVNGGNGGRTYFDLPTLF